MLKGHVFFFWLWLVFYYSSWYCPLRTGGGEVFLLNRQNLSSIIKVICWQSLKVWEKFYMQCNISDSQALFWCFALIILRMATLDTLFLCFVGQQAWLCFQLVLNFFCKNQGFSSYKIDLIKSECNRGGRIWQLNFFLFCNALGKFSKNAVYICKSSSSTKVVLSFHYLTWAVISFSMSLNILPKILIFSPFNAKMIWWNRHYTYIS